MTLSEHIQYLNENGRFLEEKKYIHHNTTTVYKHSISVAKTSLYIAKIFHSHINTNSLIKGALLHDYFLYDWHTTNLKTLKQKSKTIFCPLHGFVHPKISLLQAKQDYTLNNIEKDIILHHMFPLTIIPPKTKEGWIVSFADKIIAFQETIINRFINYSYFFFKKLSYFNK